MTKDAVQTSRMCCMESEFYNNSFPPSSKHSECPRILHRTQRTCNSQFDLSGRYQELGFSRGDDRSRGMKEQIPSLVPLLFRQSVFRARNAGMDLSVEG